MPIQIPSPTNLRPILASILLMINRKEIPRLISRKWTSLLNSRSPIYLTYSVTQMTLCIQKQTTFASRMTRTMPRLFVANWSLMLLLKRGVSFAFTFFCVLVCGMYAARFIRWDRDGAVVTRRFNYIKDPHFLAGFF